MLRRTGRKTPPRKRTGRNERGRQANRQYPQLSAAAARERDQGIMQYKSAREFADIRNRAGRYGLIDTRNGSVLLPFEYDSIAACSPVRDILCLCREGKVGAVGIDPVADHPLRWIAPCEYDCFQQKEDCLFRKKGAVRYYFAASRIVRDFSEVAFTEGPYIQATDDEYFYVLRMFYGNEIWRCSKTAFSDILHSADEEPRFDYLGERDGKPLFADIIHDGCLLPDCRGRLVYCRGLPSVIMPIIIGGKNIVNIVGDAVGVGIWDGDIRTFDYYGCEEVVAELKITLKRDGIKTEKVFPLPHGVFRPGDAVDYSEWR